MTTHVDRALFETLYGTAEVQAVAGEGGWNAPGGVRIDDARLAAAFEQANTMIDSYIVGRFPTRPTTPVLGQTGAAIARHNLRSRTDASTISAEVKARYDEALRYLRDVQAGRAALIDEAGNPIGESDDYAGSMGISDRLATESGRSSRILEGWL